MKYLLLLWTITLWSADPARIALIGGPQPLWKEIAAEFHHRYPALEVAFEFKLPTEGHRVDLAFAYYPTQEELKAWKLLDSEVRLGFPLELSWKQTLQEVSSRVASGYLDEGGVENGVRLLLYLYSLIKDGGPKPEAPLKSPASGIYHPEAPRIFTELESYLDWWRQSHKIPAASKLVAIPFFSTWLRSRDLAVVDAFIEKLETQALIPVAAFGYPVDVMTPLLTQSQGFAPEVVIALNATLASARDTEIYQSWGSPVLNGLVTRESFQVWQANAKGLPTDRMAAHFSSPERSGMVAPALVATTEISESGVKTVQPVATGVDAVVKRAVGMISLRRKPAAEKRVALIYFNNPAGKGNIGASYLQVFPSLKNILNALSKEGYRVDGAIPEDQKLRHLLEARGRNYELWSEGELSRTASLQSFTLWPVSQYRKHYNTLPVEFRKQMEAIWSAPESSRLMTVPCQAGRCFLFPAIKNCNVLLAPQPLRTTSDQASDPAHDRTTYPPHQYVAFYLWLQHEWRADALVHLGRHGTLEWLPGKQTALAAHDPPSLLIASLPNFNVYVMDGGGEAIQAKRRAQATLISHLTPVIWRTGARDEFSKLHSALSEWMENTEWLSASIRPEKEKAILGEVMRLGLDRQLHLDTSDTMDQLAPVLHRFLHETEEAPFPAGLPIFGQSPSEAQLKEGTEAFLYAAFPGKLHDEIATHVSNWAAQLLDSGTVSATGLREEIATILGRTSRQLPAWVQSLRNAGRLELSGLIEALAGKHVSSRLLGDPLRKPEALPTGGNLHAMDSARIPTEAAWQVGQQMAKDFLKNYEKSHGEMPKRVSMVLWYGETERHQGAMECMALALLGVKPVWNQRGIVETLELITGSQLSHKRIDVVITASGNYRDGFADKLQMLDRAVRLAATAADGVIAEQDRSLALDLKAAGLSAGQATRQSKLRIFSAKPGSYGVGVQYLVEKSAGVDTAKNIAALYTANMAFGYSNEQWGVAVDQALKSNLRTIDSVQFSRSSNLYGSLDNDDTYQYVGGLRTATAELRGKAPDVMMHNLRQPGTSQSASLREWLAVEVHSRQLNPRWIREMRSAGYAGARQIYKEIEHLYGFQKTAPDHLDGAVWQDVLDVYVNDKHRLGIESFFNDENPHARQAILARLIEVDRQGIHRFAPHERAGLLNAYARTVARDGATCAALDCGSSVLRSHVGKALRSIGRKNLAAKLEDAFKKEMQPPPPPAPTKLRPQLSKLKQVGKYLVTWVRAISSTRTDQPISVWVWPSLAALYGAAALLRGRGRRRFQFQQLLLHSEAEEQSR